MADSRRLCRLPSLITTRHQRTRSPAEPISANQIDKRAGERKLSKQASPTEAPAPETRAPQSRTRTPKWPLGGRTLLRLEPGASVGSLLRAGGGAWSPADAPQLPCIRSRPLESGPKQEARRSSRIRFGAPLRRHVHAERNSNLRASARRRFVLASLGLAPTRLAASRPVGRPTESLAHLSQTHKSAQIPT